MSGTISNDLYYSSVQTTKTSSKGDNSSLGKDAFLKILITQLQNQDPTNPMDDRDFIAQMAQFSSLEQMQNMTTAMESLLTSQQETQLMSYTNFVGKEVNWHELSDELDEAGNPIVQEGKGVIKEVKFVDGAPVFKLDDGKEIASGSISSVLGNSTTTQSTNPFAEASQYIGSTVKYTENDTTIEAIIEAITTKNNVVQYLLNNGTRLTKDQFEITESDNTSSKEEV